MNRTRKMIFIDEKQYPEHYFDAYGTRAFRGDYVPYESDGKSDKLSYYTHLPENGNFSRFSDGFNPYSPERYKREIGYDQGRINTGMGQYAKYKSYPTAEAAEPVKSDWLHVLTATICLIILIASVWFATDKYWDGNPELGKSAVETTQTADK